MPKLQSKVCFVRGCNDFDKITVTMHYLRCSVCLCDYHNDVGDTILTGYGTRSAYMVNEFTEAIRGLPLKSGGPAKIIPPVTG